MKKYIAYYRKSTDTEDKQVLSLDGQAEVVREFATNKGLYIPKNFEFRESFSAKKSNTRPIFNSILSLLQSNKAQGVVAYKADRLTRNYGDLDDLLDLLNTGIEIWASDYGNYTSDANGNMMLGINTVMAKRKIDDLSEDTKRGLRNKITIKEWPGWAPLGYLNLDKMGRIAGKQYLPEKQRMIDNLGKKLGRIEYDPLTALLVRKAFEVYAYQDISLKKLSDYMYEQGLRTKFGNKVKKSSLGEALNNPFYYGAMMWKKKLVPGTHEPIVTKELFDLVQEKLSSKSPFTIKPELDFIYKGLLTCGACGLNITAEHRTKKQKNGNIHDYNYYHCTKSKGNCGQPHIEEKELEKQIADIFINFFLSEEQSEAIQIKLGELYRDDCNYQVQQEKTLKSRLAKLKEEKKQMFRKMVTSEIKDDETFSEIQNDVQREITDIQQKLDNITRHSQDWLEQSSNLLYLARHAGELFLEGTKEEKHILVNCVSSNLFLKDKRVTFSLKKPFDLLAEVPKSPTGLPLKDLFCNFLFFIFTIFYKE
ncbi:MAG TPA: recombinase family protein [Candidatus Bathyarchaeia archaeon]|nr:recombinase family protein [Candidatus Bathyarchaeia archaeon]